jgi:hypothetical protein
MASMFSQAAVISAAILDPSRAPLTMPPPAT